MDRDRVPDRSERDHGGTGRTGLEVVRNLRNRYDGTRRNPYNEIECGDHYSRAMAGWSLLDALTGVRYDGLSRSLTIAPPNAPEELRAPIILGDGWGTLDWQPTGPDRAVSIVCSYGSFTFDVLDIATGAAAKSVSLNGAPIVATIESDAGGTRVSFTGPLTVGEGSVLSIEF